MSLNLGSIQLPLNAATKTFAILAKRGAGKSYTGAVLAEELHKNNVPFVVFDPIDVWWGLRLASNGKDKGLPVVVFGLEHADIPLTRDIGREIAQAIIQENVSCVISTFGMPKIAQRHLIAEFAEELLNINNLPRHVFIEEAHEFIPQRVSGALGKTFKGYVQDGCKKVPQAISGTNITGCKTAKAERLRLRIVGGWLSVRKGLCKATNKTR